jgi:hypothetical protein
VNVTVNEFFSPLGAALMAILYAALSQRMTTLLIPASITSRHAAALRAILPPVAIDNSGGVDSYVDPFKELI